MGLTVLQPTNAGQLVQLNAGGRQVASDRGWSVVDFERLASWFADPKVRLEGQIALACAAAA